MTKSTTQFKQRIKSAIDNATLQVALDQNASRRKIARTNALTALSDDPTELKKRARLIRKDVLANLEQYLDQFINTVNENGITIHRASDDKEACQIVLEIARAKSANLVAKSKSMITEEIHLNRTLETNGIRVVETDLGEFIVQLRNEPPAHIITPAVHLRREDVAETFQRHFNAPDSADIRALNDVARQQLRQIFLKADIGLSGVNFGVADTGTICLLTNEGNGRMVTTIPSTHIAMMGVERLLPSLNDLGVMLKLLPASATGQKITSYVTLIQTARQPADDDGPQERHLVLVDNGRLKVASGPYAEALLCIRCGACLNACPVFQEIGGHAYNSPYPGPIGSVISPGLFGIKEFGHLAKASTLCGACTDACPVGIEFPSLLLNIRQEFVQEVRQPIWMTWAMHLYTFIATHPRLYRAGQKFAAFTSRFMLRQDHWIRALPPPLQSWGAVRHYPSFDPQPFHERWRKRQGKFASASPAGTDLTNEKLEPPGTEKNTPHTAKNKSEADISSIIDKFARELQALDAELIISKPEHLPVAILDTLRRIDAKTILAWDQITDHDQTHLREYLHQNGITLINTRLMLRNPARQEGIQWLSKADAGLTGSLAAFASTGTIVVASGPSRSQLASLLPSTHLVIIDENHLYLSMEDWLGESGDEIIRKSQCVTFISGPSRTADIEMTLTIGVHGPKKVIVFLIDRSSVDVATKSRRISKTTNSPSS